MDIESSNILRVSTSNEFLLLQEYISQVQTISVATFQQQQYSFKETIKGSTITALDANATLVLGNDIGQLFLINPQSGALVTEVWAHQDKVLCIVALKDFCYSICMNGELKQTSCSTGQVVYSRKFASRVYCASIFFVANQFLIHYDGKVVLLDLDQDTIKQKYNISHQTPLKVRQYGQFFSVLGGEHSISQYDLHEPIPQQMFTPQLQPTDYHFIKTQQASYYLLHNANQIQGVKFEGGQQSILFNVTLMAIIGTFIAKSEFIIMRGNITSPTVKKIQFIIDKKVKVSLLGEALQEYSEIQEHQTTNDQKPHIQEEVPVGYQDFEYTAKIVSVRDDANIINSDIVSSQPLMLTNLLEQALKSQDIQLIDFALEKTAPNLIQGSVQSLSLVNLQVLQNYVVKKIVSYPYQSRVLLPWMKSIIMRGHGDFTALYYTLEERTQNYQKVKELDTKLNFLKAKNQPKREQSTRNKIVFIEQHDQITVIEEDKIETERIEGEDFDDSNGENETDFNAALKMRQYEDRQDALDQEVDDKVREEFIKF